MTDLSANQPTYEQRNVVTTLAPTTPAPLAPARSDVAPAAAKTIGVVERLAVAGGWLAGRLSGWGDRIQLKYRLFQAAAIIVPRVPLWLARPATVGGATAAWALAGGMRRRAEANLRHIPGLAADPQALRRATRGVFITSALNYLAFFRGRFLTAEQAVAPWTREGGRIAVEGLDVMAALLAQGRGLICFSAHLGDFEAAASCLGTLGYRMITPAEPLTPAPLRELVVRLRDHHGTRMIPGDSRETLREMISALRRNEIVLFAVDRYVMGASAQFSLFGAPARLPTTPVSFALRHKAPVMLLTSWRAGPRQSAGVCVSINLTSSALTAATGPNGQPQVASSVDQGDHAVRQAMTVVIAAIERQIAAHPEQWLSALTQVWDDDNTGASDGASGDASGDAERSALTATNTPGDRHL
ncbi:MAG TPA: hypothetical protein VMV29_06265 [Ktedonobacterales bacterium]|nr:hypothetical protein [Ktedonobacterales bacterium]